MENILADNENDIKHMWSMVSNHNSEGHLHMFDKDTIAKAVFDMNTGKSDNILSLAQNLIHVVYTNFLLLYSTN